MFKRHPEILAVVAVLVLLLAVSWSPNTGAEVSPEVSQPVSVLEVTAAPQPEEDDATERSKPESVPAGEPIAASKERKLATRVEHTILEQIEDAEYHFTRRSDGLFAPNRSQQMRSFFERDSLTVRPWDNEQEWGFTVSVGNAGELIAEQAKVRYQDGDGREDWFENSRRGLEHGMVLTRAEVPQDETLEFAFAVETELVGKLGRAGDIAFYDEAGDFQLRYADLYTFDARGRSVPSELGWDSERSEISWKIHHQGFQYPLTIDPLISRGLGQLPGVGAVSSNRTTSASGSTFVVRTSSAEVKIFELGGGMYQLAQTLTAPAGVGNVFFFAVEVRGDVLAVGSSAAEIDGGTRNGAVFVYRRGEQEWELSGTLTASDGAASDSFGTSLGLGDGTLVVGASGWEADQQSPDVGAVYVFSEIENPDGSFEWNEAGRLELGESGDDFGSGVALDGDDLAVRFESDNLTEIAMFERDQLGEWQSTTTLTHVGQSGGSDGFGDSIGMADGVLATGTPRSSVDGVARVGAVRLFEKHETLGTWSERAPLVIPDGGFKDEFGSSVALSGDSLVVGAEDEDYDSGIVRGGAAHLFVRSADKSWEHRTRFVPPETAEIYRYGVAVELSGEVLAISGISSSPASDHSGIYVYARPESSWAPVARGYFKSMAPLGGALIVGAPNTFVENQGGEEVGSASLLYPSSRLDIPFSARRLVSSEVSAGANFGASVCGVGTQIAVGAPGSDNDTGQVHVFEYSSGSWREVAVLEGSVAGERFGETIAMGAGGWLAVGRPAAEGGVGSVHLYQREIGGAGAWGLHSTIDYVSPFSPGSPESAAFGASLAMDSGGSLLVVGAPGASGFDHAGASLIMDAGFALVFSRDEGGMEDWGQVARLGHFEYAAGAVTVEGTGGGLFGSVVAIDGDWAGASEPGRNSTHLFHRLTQTIGASQWGDTQVIDGVSSSLAISAASDMLVAGDESTGTIEVFQRSRTEDYRWVGASTIDGTGALGFKIEPASGFGSVLAIAGSRLFAGMPDVELTPGGFEVDGMFYAYERQNFGFVLATTPVLADGGGGIQLGALAYESGTLAVRGSSDLGSSVYVVERETPSDWGDVLKLDASVASGAESFGESLSLSGDVLAVGAPGQDAQPATGFEQGAAYVFERDSGGEGTWGQTGMLERTTPAASDARFGAGISASAENVAVGLPGLNRIHLFGRDGGGWIAQKVLFGSDGFGSEIELSGSALYIGRSGSVDVRSRNNSGANQWGLSYSMDRPRGASSTFGSSLALGGGGTLAIGAPDSSDTDGRVFVYRGRFDLEARASGLDASAAGTFGDEFAIDGERLVVLSKTSADSPSWKVSLFLREQGEVIVRGDTGGWGLFDTLRDPGGSGANLSGIAIDGTTIVISTGSSTAAGAASEDQLHIYELASSLYDRWVVERFGEENVGMPALEASLWGDTADPDGDGYTNVEEAYFGLNPLVADAHEDSVRTSEDDQLIYRWTRGGDRLGIRAIPYWSSDLRDWYRSGQGPVDSSREIEVRHLGERIGGGDLFEATTPISGIRAYLRLRMDPGR